LFSPVCKKQVFTSTLLREPFITVPDENQELLTDTDVSDSTCSRDSEEDSIGPSSQERKSGTLHSDTSSSTRTSFLTSGDDISIFKRVLQEISSISIFNIAAEFEQNQQQNVASSAPNGVNGTRTTANATAPKGAVQQITSAGGGYFTAEQLSILKNQIYAFKCLSKGLGIPQAAQQALFASQTSLR
jgi:hypothetical protein